MGWEEDEDEISPWEANQRREDEWSHRHFHHHHYHHHKLGIKPAITLLWCVTLGVLAGVWLFYKLAYSGGW